jgi:SNF2 family DNA or RNA helicase
MPSTEPRPRSALRPYQVRAANWMAAEAMPPDTDGFANWTELGCGKTVSSLTALLTMLNEIRMHKALVVGPVRVITSTWPDEIAAWEHTGGGKLRYSVVHGPVKKRLAALRADADIYLISTGLLAWLEAVLTHYGLLVAKGDCKKSPFDVVVIDEASLFKSRQSIRFRVMRRIARAASRVIELTGTPATEGYLSLWSQFYLLDGGVRLQSSMGAYERLYFTNIATTELPKLVPKSAQAKQAIQERIKDITFILRAADHLTLPRENKIMVYVDMSPAERRVYDEMMKKSLIQLSDGAVIAAQSGAALQQKLAQLANGQVYDANKVSHTVHRRKLDALRDIYDEAQGQPLLVAYEFAHDRELILREFPSAVLLDDKPSTQEAFRRGKIDLLLTHPRSGGHGLNIQAGSSRLVRYGIAYSLELYLQLLHRLLRSGQAADRVDHFFIFTRDTIDDEIAEAVRSKQFSHDALLSAMHKYVARVQALDPELPRF